MQRISGLDDAQVTEWEAKIEQATVDALQQVMDTIARRFERIRVTTAAALVAADDNPPPQTGDLAIPPPEPVPATIPPPGGPPAGPYISADDLASIPPMWHQLVAEQVLPLVAQVFIDAAGHVRSQLLDHVPSTGVLSLPGLNSPVAEEYLRRARNTFSQVGDHLWATARAQMSEGFEAGESIDEMAARMRRSAGLSARSSVLVARTSVIEASNYGSISMARVSGLEMEKEWIATPDLRTRPSHLAADGQRVPLNGVFHLNTGWTCDFPAAPNLPPSERYRCRCTLGYVMPDRPKALPQSTIDQSLPGAPGAQMPQIEPELPEIGSDAIRESLRSARTLRDVDTAAMAEARRITGRDIRFDQRGTDVEIAREHAEGILRGLERFPESPLSQVGTYGPGSSAELITRARGVPDFDEPRAFTATLPGNDVILFNVRMASDPEAYLQALARGHGAGWHASGTATPMGQALHEFGHTVDETFTEAGAKVAAVRSQITGSFTREAYKSKIREDIGRYAVSSNHELGAEAFADVMINGDRASATSRAVFDAIESGYGKTHPRVFPRETAPGLPEPSSFQPARGGDFVAPGYVRPALRDAKTPREIAQIWEAQAQQITGFPFYVDRMPRGISMDTAREYAEGTLQMLAQFPGAKVDRIHWWDDAKSPAYARVNRGGHALEFNMKYASEKGRANFLEVRRRDIEGWDTHGTAWGVRNDVTGGQGVVYHEFMHILDLENAQDRVSGGLVPILLHHAGRDTIEDAIKRQVSTYATRNYNELIAEAGTDVMVNGDAASELSKEIFDLLRHEYQRRGFVLGARPPGLGGTFAREAAPQAVPLARQTVAQLRALAKERGITVPLGTRKADLVKMLEQREGLPVPVPAAAEMPRPVVGRDITSDLDAARIADLPKESRMNEILRAQGFDARPVVGDLRDVDRLIDSGGIELFRGSTAERARELISGELGAAADSMGGGAFGTGIYTGGRGVAERYAGEQGLSRMALRPDAKIIKIEDLRAAHQRLSPSWTTDQAVLYADQGRFAAALGYDAVAYGEGPLVTRNFIILNRSALMVERSPVLTTAEIRALGPKALREYASARGISVPDGARKADIVSAITEPRVSAPAAPVPTPVRATARRPRATAAETAAVRRQAVIDQRRTVADSLAEVDELLANGASARALQARATAMRALAGEGEAGKALAPVFDAMESGDAATIRAAAISARRGAQIEQIGGRAGEVGRFDAATQEVLGGVKLPAGTPVIISRPGSVITVRGERITLSKAQVTPASEAELAAAERKALRTAARTRQAEIATAEGNARLLADVEQLIQRKASKSAIAQALDPVLAEPGQLYAGADPALMASLRQALDSGDAAKLRAALTRGTRTTKVTPIGKAGAKAKYDPATMDVQGGIELPDGAPVVVVRRGARFEGLTDPLQRAQVRVDAPVLKFDAKSAKIYAPKPVVRQATIVEAPPGKITTITAPDGTTMTFRGSWVKVEEPGQPGKFYGSALDEWRDMYEEVPGQPGSWVKVAPVQAYRYHGPPKLLTTEIKGQAEKVTLVQDGDWVVRQRGGEVQRLFADRFEQLYADTPAMSSTEFNALVRGAVKGRKALSEAPVGMSGTYTNDYRFPGLTPGTREWDRARMTMRYYYGEGYDVQNGILRHADPRWRPPQMSSLYADEDPIEHIHRLDALFDDSRLQTDVVTWRGIGTGRSVFGDPDTWRDTDLTGRTWADPAYSSSTVSHEVATNYTQPEGVQLRMVIPRGGKAIQISDYGEEAELLLPRGTQFRVVADHGYVDVVKTSPLRRTVKVRQLDVEVIVPERTPPLPWEQAAKDATDVPIRSVDVDLPKRAAVPAPVSGGEDAVGRYIARQKRLDSLVENHAPSLPPEQLGGGYTADVTLETYGDDKIVRKVYGRRVPHYSRADVGRDADAEILAPRVLEAFDVDTWATSRVGRDEIIGEFIEGETFIEKVGYATVWGDDAALARAAAPYVDSPAGRRLSIADYVMGNSDRNTGNWMITSDGRIVAIDNGSAFAMLKGEDVPPAGLFASKLMTHTDPLMGPTGELIPIIPGISRADLAVIRKRLEALRPDFEAAGRLAWHKAMMRRLKVVERRLALPSDTSSAGVP